MRFIFTENDSFLPKQEIADEIKDFLGFWLVRRQQTFNLIGWYRNLVLFLFRHTRLLGYLDGFIYNSTSIYIKQPQKSLIENRFLSLLCFMLSLLLLVLCFQHFFTNSKSYPDYDKLFFGSRITFSSVLFSHVFFTKNATTKSGFLCEKKKSDKKDCWFRICGGIFMFMYGEVSSINASFVTKRQGTIYCCWSDDFFVHLSMKMSSSDLQHTKIMSLCYLGPLMMS